MISHEELEDAVQAGVLTPDTALALRRHVAQRRQAPSAEEEHFRLLTGFNDLFVVIAGLLVLISLRWLVDQLSGPVVGSLTMSAAAWALAEYFVRQRRLALPALVLTATCLAGVYLALMDGWPPGGLRMPAAAAATCAMALLHWRRFRVPITPALAAAAVANSMAQAVPEGVATPLLAAFGAGVLAAAVACDMSDRARLTRRADMAFWLHLLAAPLIVHSSFAALDVFQGQPGLGVAALVCAGYAVMAWVSLVLDRRALMVSALGYVLFALAAVLGGGERPTTNPAAAALLVGSLLLLMSARWGRLRRWALAPLPAAWQARLAPLRPDAG
jgi:hypothetical protein